jgi:hypothetical protein
MLHPVNWLMFTTIYLTGKTQHLVSSIFRPFESNCIHFKLTNDRQHFTNVLHIIHVMECARQGLCFTDSSYISVSQVLRCSYPSGQETCSSPVTTDFRPSHRLRKSPSECHNWLTPVIWTQACVIYRVSDLIGSSCYLVRCKS